MTTRMKSSAKNAKDRILDAAARVLAEQGYQGTNIDEIVALSDTSKGSFYFHFPSKESMVLGLVDQLSEKLVNKIERSLEKEPRPLHRIALAIDTLLYAFSGNRSLARMLLVNIIGQGKVMDKKFLPIRDRFAALIKRELDRAVAAGIIQPQDTIIASHVWLGALYEVILRWLLTEKPVPIDEVSPKLRSLLLSSVGADFTLLQRAEV